MSVFVENSGFVRVDTIVDEIVTTLLANGFVQQYPATPYVSGTDRKVVLKAGPDLDPLSTSQPWAIKFEWDNPANTDGMCDVWVATPAQFNADGSHTTYLVNPDDATTTEALGLLGCTNKTHLGSDGEMPKDLQDFPDMAMNRDPVSKTFLYRKQISSTDASAYPMSYRIGVSPRGVYVCVWEETSDAVGNKSSWFVVQRPVHAITTTTTTGQVVSTAGDVVTTGKCPVHCIYGLGSMADNKPWLDTEYYRAFAGFPWQIVRDSIALGASLTSNTTTAEPDSTGSTLADHNAIKEFYSKIMYGGTFTAIPSNSICPEKNLPTINWKGISQAHRTVPKAKSGCLNRFVVREKDVTAPYPIQQYIKNAVESSYDYSEYGMQFGVPADEHSVDYTAIINTKQQVAIGEGNKYIITFPNNVNTSRFAYTHEMDMIAYTSADVVSDGTEVTVRVYGESTDRVYIGGKANGPNNTGLRILYLKSGGGIV